MDYGTGSGVLAIAALLLGAAEAVGTDVDSLAVKAANRNAELNGGQQEAVTDAPVALACLWPCGGGCGAMAAVQHHHPGPSMLAGCWLRGLGALLARKSIPRAAAMSSPEPCALLQASRAASRRCCASRTSTAPSRWPSWGRQAGSSTSASPTFCGGPWWSCSPG
jgi:hypothetical protein